MSMIGNMQVRCCAVLVASLSWCVAYSIAGTIVGVGKSVRRILATSNP